MGYYANSRESDFLIRKENFCKLIRAVIPEECGKLAESITIERTFERFGFSVETNRHGDIDSVWYEYQKFHKDDMESFFSVIAPFVVAGSYITFEGEDSSLWAYYFDGETWEEYAGEITFPGMPMIGPNLEA